MRQWIKRLMMVLLLIVGTIPVAFARGGPGGFHGGFHGGGFGHGGFHDHIPTNLVVTSSVLHDGLDISSCYPHRVSCADEA